MCIKQGKVYVGLALALCLVLVSVDLTQSDLVAKVVVWDNDDLTVKYATQPRFSTLNASLLGGGGKCTNNGFHFPQLGCACPDGFSGESCSVTSRCASNPCIRGKCRDTPDGYSCRCDKHYYGTNCDKKHRERRDTDQLQLACHHSLNGSELVTCDCEYLGRSEEVMYCRVPEGHSCIIPQEYPPSADSVSVEIYQISYGTRVIVPPPSGVCHPHFDYTLEPHPRPVIIDMDKSSESRLSTSGAFLALHEDMEMDIVITLVAVVQTSSSVNGSLGSHIRLPCSYDGDISTVRWYKEDDPLMNLTCNMYGACGIRDGGKNITGHYSITDGFSLIIKNATMEDAGRYYCEVLDLASGDLVRGQTDVYITGHAVNDSTAFPAVVTPSTSSPQCAISPISDTLIQGDLVTLTCQSTGGSPQPQLSWTNDNGLIAYRENNTKGESSTISTLSLLLSPELYGAVFTCRSTHPGYAEPRECAIPPLTFKPIKETSPIRATTVIVLGIVLSIYLILTVLLWVWCFLSRRIWIKKIQQFRRNQELLNRGSVHTGEEQGMMPNGSSVNPT